jgi:hypothetical protein
MIDANVIFVRLIQRHFVAIVEVEAKLGKGKGHIEIG